MTYLWYAMSMWPHVSVNIYTCVSQCVCVCGVVLVVSRTLVDQLSDGSYTSDQQKTDESHLISVAAQRREGSYFPGNTHTHTLGIITLTYHKYTVINNIQALFAQHFS